MKITFPIVAILLIVPLKVFSQTFPFKELSKTAFIQFETKQGSRCETSKISYILSPSVYPYESSYKMTEKPINGDRPLTVNSITDSFQAYYDMASMKVKYIHYMLSPKTKSAMEIGHELMLKGEYSSKNFIKMLNEQVDNPVYQKKINETYQKIKNQLSSKGKLVQNREDLNSPYLKKVKSYKIKQAVAELSIYHQDGVNQRVQVDIYWK